MVQEEIKISKEQENSIGIKEYVELAKIGRYHNTREIIYFYSTY